MDYCRTVLLPLSFDIIAVFETWFHPAFTDKMAEIKGYSLVRNDRQGRSSGGVALYIKSHIPFKILSSSKDTGVDKLPEYLICEVTFLNTQIMVAVVYRPPDHQLSYSTDFLDIISSTALNYNSKVILGDFNVNMSYFHSQSLINFLIFYLKIIFISFLMVKPTEDPLPILLKRSPSPFTSSPISPNFLMLSTK